MSFAKYEPCENCSILDYIAVIAFAVHPPAGLFLLMIRRQGWKLAGIEWQEYLFLIVIYFIWIILFFTFGHKFINGVIIANFASISTIMSSCFMNIFIPVKEYYSRFIIATFSSIVSIWVPLGFAKSCDEPLLLNSCSTKMQYIGFVTVILLVVIYIVIPKINSKTSLLTGISRNKTEQISVKSITDYYTSLLLAFLFFSFLDNTNPNIILVLWCVFK